METATWEVSRQQTAPTTRVQKLQGSHFFAGNLKIQEDWPTASLPSSRFTSWDFHPPFHASSSLRLIPPSLSRPSTSPESHLPIFLKPGGTQNFDMQNRKELNLAVVPLAPQKSCCGSALELEMKLFVFRQTRWLCNLKAKCPDTDDAEQFMWQDCPGAVELETLPLKQCWQENKKKNIIKAERSE